MTEPTLAARLAERCWVTGEFMIRSGHTATSYFDKFRFTADPELLAEVAEALVPLVPDSADALAGLELGGVPIATALSLATGLPAVFVRKEAKAYGTAKLAEGGDIVGRRLVIIEDVISTGGQVAISALALRDLGALVDVAVCVVDRSTGNHVALDEADVALRSLFTAFDVPPR